MFSPTRHKLRFVLVNLLLIGALALAACSPAMPGSMDDAASSAGAADSSAEASAAESSSYNPQPAYDAPPSSTGGSATGGSTAVNDEPYDSTFYQNYGVNPFIDTEDDHLSTFAVDVDTGSYTVMRRYLGDGHLPDPDSVRVEEYVNYFNYAYEPPQDSTFAIHMEGAPSPFGGERYQLLRIGLQGEVIDDAERLPASLVFVIDVSGSMDQENRLGAVKQSLRMLVDELRGDDEVAIVVYGSRAYTILEPTSIKYRDTILQAIERLQPDGSTNAEEGLRLGYEMAERMVAASQQVGETGRIVRLVLCSDGVANVGNTGPDSILAQVQEYVDQGITLSTVGFGMGNYNDVLMEQLANDGDGQYAYVDSQDAAHRFFVENLTGMLQVIAKDAKVQVEFNEEVVSRYRLIGYENRDVADDDFRDDEVDAGEVGAGHSVTALYEIKLHPGIEPGAEAAGAGNIATVYIRYNQLETGEIVEVNQTFTVADLDASFDAASPDFRLAAAVAEYAELLRDSYWAREGSLAEVSALADNVAEQYFGADRGAYEDAQEFAELVERAASLQ